MALELSYGSVCSGIEAASVAWEPLGFKPLWFSEIEKFPSRVLQRHWPHVPNMGDMRGLPTLIELGVIEAPDILVGGTPCQSFSIAGMRKGLSDVRGNLTLTYIEIANAIDEERERVGKPPCITVWENVPGVLSSKDNAFGCFLAGLVGEGDALDPPGRKWSNAGLVVGPQRAAAWRVLDAQYFGLAQRRKRVFVVSSARERFDPGAVLFELESVRRDSPPSREPRQDPTSGPGASLAFGGGRTGGSLDVAATLVAKGMKLDFEVETFVAEPIAFSCKDYGADATVDLAPTLRAMGHSTSHANAGGQLAVVYGTQDPCVRVRRDSPPSREARQDPTSSAGSSLAFGGWPADVASTLNAAFGKKLGLEDQHVNSGCPLFVPEPIAFSCKDYGADATVDLAPTLRAMGHSTSHANAGGQLAVMCFDDPRRFNGPHGGFDHGDLHPTLESTNPKQVVLAAVCVTGQENAVCVTGDVTHALTAEGFDASEDGTGRGNPNAGPDGAAFRENVAYTLEARSTTQSVAYRRRVRRLMPVECARLQGFPDGHTELGPNTPDCPQYKALGNSKAVPVVSWIGRRIQSAVLIEDLL